MPWTDEEVRQLVRESSAGIGGCPPAETLTRAVSGGLAREDAELVADHLADCADCAEDAQALRSLESWAGRAALDGASPGRRTREIATRRASRPLMGMAAALFVATGALTAGLLHVRGQSQLALAALRSQVEERAQSEGRLRAELALARERGNAAVPVSPPAAPQALANVPIVDLLPAGASRGTGSPVAAVPAGTPLVVGVLTVPSDTPPYADYAIEVRQGERLAYRGQGLARSREDTFTIALPAGLLGRGENRIRLLGLHVGRPAALIEEYGLRVSES